MAKCFSLLVCFLVLFHGCVGQQQPSRRRHQNECRISRLNAQRPSRTIKSEAGVTEVFDHNSQDLRCAGVAFVRYTIESKGLLLPSYVNAPQLMYFIQGRGWQGIVTTGCPETYQSFQESQRGQQEQEQQGQQGERQHRQQGEQGQQEQQGQQQEQQRDLYQKIRRVEEGDIMVVTVGTGHYIYNDGNRPLVVVSVLDINNDANQLDFEPRRFYLAGNPQDEFQPQQGQQEQQGQGQQGREQQQQGEGTNIFNGFDAERLAEAFRVDVGLIRRIQGQKDKRGNIVRVEGGLQGVLPPSRRQGEGEQQQQQDPLYGYATGNGYEETICTMKLGLKINDPSRADVYTAGAGHRTSVTGYDLPVLRNNGVRLSAHQGHLHQNAIMLPYYNVNAHSILYVIRGSARIDVVQQNGQNVFNEEVQQGQVLVIPQNFASMIKAGNSGFEYVAFKTDENALINTLAGRLSLLRAMPLNVISSSFQISNEHANQLKNNRKESVIAPQGSSRSQYVAYA